MKQFELIKRGKGVSYLVLPDILASETSIYLDGSTLYSNEDKQIGKLKLAETFNTYETTKMITRYTKIEVGISIEPIFYYIGNLSSYIVINYEKKTYYYAILGTKNGVTSLFNVFEMCKSLENLINNKPLQIIKNWSWNFTKNFNNELFESSIKKIVLQKLYETKAIYKNNKIFVNPYRIDITKLFIKIQKLKQENKTNDEINLFFEEYVKNAKSENKENINELATLISSLKTECPDTNEFLDLYTLKLGNFISS